MARPDQGEPVGPARRALLILTLHPRASSPGAELKDPALVEAKEAHKEKTGCSDETAVFSVKGLRDKPNPYPYP